MKSSEPNDDAPAPSLESGTHLLAIDSAIFSTVNVELKARLGKVVLTVKDLLALRAGSVVKLDTQLNDAIELHLNGVLVGRGEIVAVDDNFGVRIIEIAPTQ